MKNQIYRYLIITMSTVFWLILVKLKPKSTGPDNLSPKLLKSTRFELCDIIVYLGNLSIDTSTAPTQNKQSNITPIGKSQHPTKPSDFR